MTGRSRDLGGGRRDRVPRASGSSSPRESTSLVLSLPSWRRAGGGANAISSTLPPPSWTPPFLPPPSLICRSTSSCPLSTSLPQINTQPAILSSSLCTRTSCAPSPPLLSYPPRNPLQPPAPGIRASDSLSGSVLLWGSLSPSLGLCPSPKTPFSFPLPWSCSRLLWSQLSWPHPAYRTLAPIQLAGSGERGGGVG